MWSSETTESGIATFKMFLQKLSKHKNNEKKHQTCTIFPPSYIEKTFTVQNLPTNVSACSFSRILATIPSLRTG